ncbi:mitochondrial distribution and morphology family protein [Cryomyces antarcticus]
MSYNVGSRLSSCVWASTVARPWTGRALHDIHPPLRHILPSAVSASLLQPLASRAFSSRGLRSNAATVTASLGLRGATSPIAFRTHLRPARNPSIADLAAPTWRRSVHSRGRRKRNTGNRRNKSTATNGSGTPKQAEPTGNVPMAELSPNPKTTTKPSNTAAPSAAGSKTLLDRLPHLPHNLHRPTKEELLGAATGFWSRMRVRFKWFSIRSVRPFNTDDISAFVSWFFLGHIIWIILGTTTFFSLVILTVNTVFAQETLAGWIGNYLTKSSGVKVVFESAIVPKWGDGVITFKKVFVSRRPGQGQSNVRKGSSTTAAAVAAAAALAEKANAGGKEEEEDTNYTQFDVSLETINVTLSFTKWFNGKGLLADVEAKGIRGVVDRTSVHALEEYVDPRTYKHEHNPGDFELDSFRMEDLLVTVYQPGNFRPFSVSIFSCDLPQLRKQWLFYDFLSANMMSGSFDDSLFTIHPRQTHNYTGAQLSEGREVGGEASEWKKHSRLRIDSLNIDHLNRGVEGPFSWIQEGNVDIVADIMFPADNEGSIAKVMSDFYDRMEATVTSRAHLHEHDANTSSEHAVEAAAATPPTDDDNRFLVMDLRVHLNDVRAAVPLFTRDLSYVNNALIRPIVAYINSKKAFIPINCRVVKRASEFDGSWTIFDSGLMDDLSRETYEAFARDIVDYDARTRRLKKVGLWTIQLAAQALFIGLAGQLA